jgi:hypothetical protein
MPDLWKTPYGRDIIQSETTRHQEASRFNEPEEKGAG